MCSALQSSEMQETKFSNICFCYRDSFHIVMLRSNLSMTALIPLKNPGFLIFLSFFIFLKSKICKAEEISLRFVEYCHFCCSLYFFPAMIERGQRCRAFIWIIFPCLSAGGIQPPAPACCRQNPSHGAPPHTGIKARGQREKGISVSAVHVQIQNF